MLKISLLLSLISIQVMSQDIKNKDFDKVVREYTSKFNVSLISVEKLKELIQVKKDSMVILDARELKEYEVSKIKDAQYVGYDNFDIDEISSQIKENKEVVVYCSVGYRSGDIAERLKKKGYKVHNLYGGIFEWVNQGNDVYDSKNQVTSRVHTYNKSWSKWLFIGDRVY